MSKKHFDEYFNKVANDYKDMLDAIHDLEEECNKGLVDPDQLDAMKELIKPLKNNYMTLSWVMFLLNMPNRDKKKKKYEKIELPQMQAIDPNQERSPDAIINEDKTTINKLKNVFK